jgi:hypothetical protein
VPGLPDSPYSNAQRVEGWRADLKVLRTELPKMHVNLFAKLSQAQWEALCDKLNEAIPTLSDDQVIVELMKLTQRVGDSHTFLTVGARAGFRFFPLSLYWFSDGVYVLQTTPEHKELLKARLTGIDGQSVEAALKAVSEVIPHENEAQLRSQAPYYLIIAEVLAAQGVAKSADKASFSFTLSDGTARDVELDALVPSKELVFESALDPSAPKPYYLHNPGQVYWTEYLPFSQTMYLAYNSCREAPELPMATFVKQLQDGLSGQPVKRLVIDLRANGGGNSAVLDPLITMLAGRKDINQPGKLYVLIGRRTFSSALLNALSFKYKTKALLVGEATGGKPSHFGEVKSFELPVSGLKVSYSTKFFKAEGFDGDSLLPDIAVETSFADFIAGKDPEMEKVVTL